MKFSQLLTLAAITGTMFAGGSRVRVKGSVDTERHVSDDIPSDDIPDGQVEVYANRVCSGDSEQMCPQCKLAIKSAKCEDFRMGDKVDPETFPIVVAKVGDVPEEIQGVFWLTKQWTSSALVSFGRNNDGGGLSILDEKGTGNVRVGGDRVWSFSDKKMKPTDNGTNFERAFNADLIYQFNFDNNFAPRHAQIYPSSNNYGVGLGYGSEFLLDFQMYLLQCPNFGPFKDDSKSCASDSDVCLQESWDSAFNWTSWTCADGEEYCSSWAKDMHRCCPDTCGVKPMCDQKACQALDSKGTCTYPNKATWDPYCNTLDDAFKDSYTWIRTTSMFGSDDGDYKAVQVIKADGTKLPAFYKYLEFCNSTDTGHTPGYFHYREADTSIKCYQDKSDLCETIGLFC